MADEAVSKSNLYAALSPPVDENVSKSNLYAVLAPPVDVNVSKAVAYVVLTAVAPSMTHFVQVCC